MKNFLILVMIVSCLVGGVASGNVSSRLGRFVYFDSILFREAKNGSIDAITSVIAHLVFLASFMAWFYLSLK
jgi:hypothetical protein